MAEKSFPFDGGQVVSEAEWAAMARNWLGTGVIESALDELEVSADGSGMAVSVAAGQAWIEGFMYESDAVEELEIDVADGVNPRYDTVVLRLDRTANSVVLDVLTGAPGAVPADPALTQTDVLYEIALARVEVTAAAVVIAADKVTDQRDFAANAQAAADALAAHLADTDTAHSASAIDYPGGTNVEDALDDLAGDVAAMPLIATGNYTGDGTANRDIALAFTPKFVVVSARDGSIYAWSNVGAGTYGAAVLANEALSVPTNNNTRRPLLQANAFRVSSGNLNDAAIVYDYVAFA